MKSRAAFHMLVALVIVLITAAVVSGSGGRGADQADAPPVPALMNYQGVLLDPQGGLAVSDGDYMLKFALYNSASAPAPLWNETQTTRVERGVFSVLLGSVQALPSGLFVQPLYLGVTVGDSAEMQPRQQLVSVAYAFIANQAGNTDTLDNLHADAFAAAQHNHWGESWQGDGAGLTLTGGAGDGTALAVNGDDGKGVAASSRDGAALYGISHRFGVGVHGEGERTGGWFHGNINGLVSSGGDTGGAFSGSTAVHGAGETVGVKGTSDAGTGVRGEGGVYGVYGSGQTGGYFVAPAGGTALETNGRALIRGDLRVTGNLTTEGAVSGFPRPDYISLWVPVAVGQSVEIYHHLGGAPENYVVDLTCNDPTWGSGINQIAIGGDYRPEAKGVYWEALTDVKIKVSRMEQDVRCPQVRVRIWTYR